MNVKPTFAFQCSYMASVWYVVHDETGRYEIEMRRRVDDYERSTWNGGPAEYDAHCIPLVGTIKRSSSGDRPIPMATARAFNAWLLERHDVHTRQILGDPGRYGVIAADDPILALPMLASAIARWIGDRSGGFEFTPITKDA